uniref:Protochlorophyllide reductase n=1 Tax=Prymnesium polylepis TaxID=72548 RepID=A0A7S4MVT8_9EUKA
MPVADKWYPAFVESLPSLEGKCIAITGTTSGTGFVCALTAVQKGAAAVLLLNRASSRATEADKLIVEAAEGSKTAVHSVVCDLMSLDSAKKAAEETVKLANKFGGLDVFAENAGIMAMPDDRTKDGYDVQIQVNHLSHFLMTSILMPSLEKASKARGEARIVTHSSAARFLGLQKLPFGATFEKCEANTLGGNSGAVKLMNFVGPQIMRYCHSKLANSVFVMALHEKLAAKGSKVKAIAAEPGIADTKLMVNGFNTKTEVSVAGSLKSGALKMFSCISVMQSAADGALPLMAACFASDAASGDMYCPSKKAVLPTGAGPKIIYNKGPPFKTIVAGVPIYGPSDKKERDTVKPENLAILWEKSEAATGVKFTV